MERTGLFSDLAGGVRLMARAPRGNAQIAADNAHYRTTECRTPQSPASTPSKIKTVGSGRVIARLAHTSWPQHKDVLVGSDPC
jgi:hypothetical protein